VPSPRIDRQRALTRPEKAELYIVGLAALTAATAGKPKAAPCTLRHSFCSRLLHEGRWVIYVTRRMGHDAQLTLSTYGHVIERSRTRPEDEAEEHVAQSLVDELAEAEVDVAAEAGERIVGAPAGPLRRWHR
jgi:site-specific recombinase XerD